MLLCFLGRNSAFLPKSIAIFRTVIELVDYDPQPLAAGRRFTAERVWTCNTMESVVGALRDLIREDPSGSELEGVGID